MASLDFLDGKSESKPEKKSEKKNGIKNLFKKKPFLIAVIVVAFIAVIVFLRKNNDAQSDAELEGQNVVIDEGLQGVSVLGGSGGMSSGEYDAIYSYVDETLAGIGNAYVTELDNLTTSAENIINSNKDAYDVEVDNMAQEIENLADKLDTQADTLLEQSETIMKQNDINMMQRNADAWHVTGSDEQREALHKANQSIADKWGWSFDDVAGYWKDETGSRLFTTVMQETSQGEYIPSKPASSIPSTVYKSGSSSGSSSSQKQKDIAQMKANSEAWHNADAQTRTELEQANKQIASQYGFTFDNDSGHWYDGESKVYSPDTSSTGKSSTTITKEEAYNSGKKADLSKGYFTGTLSGKKIT